MSLAAALAAGPRVVEGYRSLQWARHHLVEAGRFQRPSEHARQAGHFAARTLEAFAPLPVGTAITRDALDLAARLQPKDPTAARTVYTEVRGALERLRASRVRGFGLGALAEDVRRREAELQARGTAP
jgi:hypothetical protein